MKGNSQFPNTCDVVLLLLYVDYSQASMARALVVVTVCCCC